MRTNESFCSLLIDLVRFSSNQLSIFRVSKWYDYRISDVSFYNQLDDHFVRRQPVVGIAFEGVRQVEPVANICFVAEARSLTHHFHVVQQRMATTSTGVLTVTVQVLVMFVSLCVTIG